jgi:two-component system sensor histidine kinase KdpD
MGETERGKLKVFIGYAAGVGKTYKMLEEAQALKSQGLDVVIGYFEPHGRKDTIAKTEGLEVVPRKVISYRGSVFEEMDTGAIVARRPQICAVDEYAHTNVLSVSAVFDSALFRVFDGLTTRVDPAAALVPSSVPLLA